MLLKYTFSYSKYIVDLIRKIERELGQIELNPSKSTLEVQLRKKNQIKTIVGSCQIEGNTLTVENVTSLINGKIILGNEKEILEVKNAILLYEKIETFNPESKSDLLKAHRILMNDLHKSAGSIRKVNVGVGGTGGLKYLAPIHEELGELLNELFNLIKKSEFDEITMSALVHLFIESIHPFIDGNGRIGRFWHTLFLTKKVNPIFQYLNIEGLIKEQQEGYYQSLIKSQKNKNSNYFVEFMLKIILNSLIEYRKNQSSLNSSYARLTLAREFFKRSKFSRIEYMNCLGITSTATGTRDLAYGVDNGQLEKIGSNNQTKYKFIG